MLLNNLADVARSAGLNVQETSGWKGHNHGPMVSVESVIVHHTAGAKTGDYPSLGVVRDGRSDLAGPLAQLGLGRSGKVYVISNGLAWHAGVTRAGWQDNSHAIGIEVESTGDGTPWTSAQLNAVAALCAALCRAYDVSVSRVLGHKEICYPVGRKIDPVGIPGGMDALRNAVMRIITNAPQEDDVSAVDVWSYENAKALEAQGRPVKDAYWYVTESYAVAAETQRRVTAGNAAVSALAKIISANTGATVAEITEAVEQGVAQALANAATPE